MLKLVNHAGLCAERMGELQNQIPEQQNLKDLMEWALSHPTEFLPTVVSNVIVQDEFTHDVIVPWRDQLVLVYDTT